MGANDEQIAFWNGPGGERWVREQAERDAMLGPYGDAALDAARVQPGEAVLDVGCGCGTTSLVLADRVGARGRVVGVDLSAPMIARAKELAKGRANVSFAAADASAAPDDDGTSAERRGPHQTPRAFDVLYSRFGVMFFGDPAAAFTQLRASLKPGGRVAFVCWRTPAENPWAKLPLEAAVRVLGEPPSSPPPPPDAPGPFAFADAARVRAILAQAGFASADVARLDRSVVYGATLEEAAKRVASMGPAARLIADKDEATVARVVAGTREAIAPYATDAGVAIPGAAWVVTAQ